MAGDWNKVWQERGEERLTPDTWLIRALPLLPPGRLLDVACGRGRNALFMAEKGYVVTAVDASAEGLSQLAAEAGQRDLTIALHRQDLEAKPDLPAEAFDVVLQFFYLQRSLIPALKQAVRPGGVAVVRTFSHAGPWAGGPGHPEYALGEGELLKLFAGWEILLHEEGLEQSHRGGSLAGIVARRPAI
ncbi:MAG: methyltransferase domain-containing protein [Syntrophotaleaceae bacterium]